MDVITKSPPITWWSRNRLNAELRAGAYEKDSELFKFADDIWGTQRPIQPHVDRTEPGWLTVGCVISNPSGYVLVGVDGVWQLPEGCYFELRPHVAHAIQRIDDRDTGGLFSFLAWDVREEDADLPKLRRQISDRLYQHGWAYQSDCGRPGFRWPR